MIEKAETACPQCGALLTMPHQVDTFACLHCGSSLHSGEALGLHRLVEPPSIDRRSAERLFRSWAAGDDVPADLSTQDGHQVHALHYFPFLRVRRTGPDRVAPLASLPVPEVMSLARAPALLQPEGPAAPPESAPRRVSEVGQDTEWIEVDGAMLREQLRQAASDPEAIEILIEQRCYFPVRYVYKGAQYSAIVGAGAGKVMADHRPARADVPADKRVALGALAVLFVEALLLPGIVLKLAVIGITAVGLYPVLCRYVERHG